MDPVLTRTTRHPQPMSINDTLHMYDMFPDTNTPLLTIPTHESATYDAPLFINGARQHQGHDTPHLILPHDNIPSNEGTDGYLQLQCPNDVPLFLSPPDSHYTGSEVWKAERMTPALPHNNSYGTEGEHDQPERKTLGDFQKNKYYGPGAEENRGEVMTSTPV